MTGGAGILGTGLMAAITFPVAFFIARACLNGVVRLIGNPDREK
jgi:hypothetical protein